MKDKRIEQQTQRQPSRASGACLEHSRRCWRAWSSTIGMTPQRLPCISAQWMFAASYAGLGTSLPSVQVSAATMANVPICLTFRMLRSSCSACSWDATAAPGGSACVSGATTPRCRSFPSAPRYKLWWAIRAIPRRPSAWSMELFIIIPTRSFRRRMPRPSTRSCTCSIVRRLPAYVQTGTSSSTQRCSPSWWRCWKHAPIHIFVPIDEWENSLRIQPLGSDCTCTA